MALELFRLLRQSTYALLRSLPDGVWSHAVTRDDTGRMTFDDWLLTYERHVPEHVAQMREIYAAWRGQRGEPV